MLVDMVVVVVVLELELVSRLGWWWPAPGVVGGRGRVIREGDGCGAFYPCRGRARRGRLDVRVGGGEGGLWGGGHCECYGSSVMVVF